MNEINQHLLSIVIIAVTLGGLVYSFTQKAKEDFSLRGATVKLLVVALCLLFGIGLEVLVALRSQTFEALTIVYGFLFSMMIYTSATAVHDLNRKKDDLQDGEEG